jgi:hypothetical protein
LELNELDNFFIKQTEENNACLQFLRNHLLSFNTEITEHYKWKLPFYNFKGKMFCYLWIDKKTQHPYICFVKGKHSKNPHLEFGARKTMKALTINPNEDIPVDIINNILEELILLY